MLHRDLNVRLGCRQAERLLLQWHLCELSFRHTNIPKGKRREEPSSPAAHDEQRAVEHEPLQTSDNKHERRGNYL